MACNICIIKTDNEGKSYIVKLCKDCSYRIVTKGEIIAKTARIDEIIEYTKGCCFHFQDVNAKDEIIKMLEKLKGN